MTRPFDLRGAAAVLTAAGSGIGRAAALAFAGRGARLVVTDRDGERARAVAAEVAERGGDAVALAVDVTVEADLVAARDACVERFGTVELVMNNAGALAMGPPESLPDEAWTSVLDVNLLSLARSHRVFLPPLLAQGRGHVVNTASASGLLAYGHDRLPYVASKHAVVGVSEALARYLGPRGIGVTCLCPSGVMTNIVEQVRAYGDAAAAPRAPGHPVVEAEVVGEMAAEAVSTGRFLVVTAPGIHDELVERARDVEAYIRARIEEEQP